MVVRSEHNFWAMPLELFDDWWVLVVQKGKLLLCFTQSRVATLGASNSSKNARGLANYPSCFTLEGPAIIQRFGRPNLERRWWANSSWWLLGRQNPLPWALATFPLVLLTHGCFVPAQCECRQHCAACWLAAPIYGTDQPSNPSQPLSTPVTPWLNPGILAGSLLQPIVSHSSAFLRYQVQMTCSILFPCNL